MVGDTVWTTDHEEIRKAVQGCTNIGLWTSTLVPEFVDRLPTTPIHVERLDPAGGVIAVGLDNDIRVDLCIVFRFSLLDRLIWARARGT